MANSDSDSDDNVYLLASQMYEDLISLRRLDIAKIAYSL